MWQRAWIVVVGLLLAACTPGKQSADMWEDYLSRLERVLETDIEPAPVNISRYPVRKALRQSFEEISIGMLDFLSILECDLNRVIASRNSVLGKVMQDSQQWLYAVELIKALQHCIAILNQQPDPPEIVPELQTIMQIKRTELTGVVWNATYAGPEFQQFMSSKNGALAADFQFAYYANLTSALAQLSQWTAAPMLPGNSSEYETVNQQLVTYPLYGRLMFSLAEATTKLESVATTLRHVIASRPLCFSPKPTPKARIMRNVLVNIYNARVQPYIAQISKAHTEWHQLLLAGIGDMPVDVLGKVYQSHLTQSPQSIYGQFKNASIKHSQAWNELLEHCGMQPGNA